MSKKDLTQAASTAADKFFSNHADVTKHEYTNKNTHVTNKSKHYDERGKRDVRHSLMLDRQLKEDLIHLCSARGVRSMNDYIVSLLIEHTGKPENKKLLMEYRKLGDKSEKI